MRSSFGLAPLLRTIAVGAVALASIFASTAAPAAENSPVTIHAAITPVYYDAVPVLYALKTGMFAKAGLDVHLDRLPTGAAITAAVAGGSLDIGKSSLSSVLSAFSHGVPITVIAPGAVYDAGAPNCQIMVATSSPIHDAAGLAGKTIGLNNINDPTRPATQAWLEQNGVDSRKVHFVEVEQSALAAAVEAHRVDAGILTTPRLEEAQASGKLRGLYPVMSAIAPRFLFSAYLTRTAWAEQHRDAVRKFAQVLAQAAAYTNAHHTTMTTTIAELVGSKPEVIAHETWPTGGTELSAGEIQPLIDIGVKYGLLAHPFPAKQIIFDASAK
jgi:NitT/TauT family transport system substrate-binding protein